MAHQQNPFALLLDDDEGDDFSILLSNLEPKIPVLPPPSSERTNPKNETNEFPSKPHSSSPNELVRGRGRGYGGRGGAGRGRGRSFAGFGEVGGEFREKSDFGDVRQTRNDARRFGEENQRPNGEERESFGFRGYDQNRRMREFRDGEGHGKSYGGDGEGRGFRGGEGRGRGFGGRGWRGGRDGGRGGGRNESNEGFNADESKKVFGDEKEIIVNDISNGDGVSGRYDVFFDNLKF